jgi:hypothetical protein
LFNSKQNSNLQGVIDYFSAPNLLDTFNLGSDFNYNSLQTEFFQKNSFFINENTTSSLNSWDNTFKNNLIDYRSVFNLKADSANTQVLRNYINDILFITPEYNNITTLTEFFPEKVMHFENFELSNLEPDEGVFEALSTPDLKIFYPEPFIASPSFVHEDLWFLHILHFQHWL